MAFKPGCSECGSFAINHQCHGRDGSDGHLCDVCYWRTRAERLQTELANTENQLNEADAMVQEMQAIIDEQGL